MVTRHLRLAVAVVLPLLAAGCVTSGPDVEARTRAKAVELVRQDVGQLDESWQGAVSAALGEGRSRAAARAAGRRAVTATPVAHLTVLADSATGGQPTDEVTLPVAVVEQVDGSGGSFAKRETVRMCVLLVTPVVPSGTPAVRDLGCPASLPDTVPGLGTVTATVPYS